MHCATRLLGGLILAVLAQGPVQAATAPACAGPPEISRARIVRVEQNGALMLSDGRALLLEGIRLPQADDKAPRNFVDEARAALTLLARDGLVTGRAVPPKQDRYDRVRVQGFNDTAWLQKALLERGLARVSIAPDREECAAELYRFEAEARRRRIGLWANAAYRVRGNRDDWRPDVGSFQLIEGRIGRVQERDGRWVLDFGADGKSGLLVVIAADERRSVRSGGFDPASLEGRNLRVRGVVQNVGGRPQIVIGSRAPMEMLP